MPLLRELKEIPVWFFESHKCCSVTRYRNLTETPNLNMNGHHNTIGSGATLTTFLIHRPNQITNKNRLVDHFFL